MLQELPENLSGSRYNLGQWHKFRGSVLMHSRPIKQGCKCMPACLSVCLSACLSICPYVDGRGPAAVLLHLAASNNLMGCLICTSDFLHRQCSTFSTLIFRLPLLTSQKLKTNTHVSTHVKYTNTALTSYHLQHTLLIWFTPQWAQRARPKNTQWSSALTNGTNIFRVSP